MQFNFSLLLSEIFNELIRSITGRLFSESDIKQITNHSLGRYFSSLFPEDPDTSSSKEKIIEAKNHIRSAVEIVDTLKRELNAQSETLDQLTSEIEEKKKTAERYTNLANTNSQAADAIRDEIRASIRDELVSQSETGRTIRRIASLVIWSLTLILGAALGNYFDEILSFLSKPFEGT